MLPQAVPGILTGAILAMSRAAGEVAPILFTGAAYYMADLPKSLHDQFMDLGYHVFILSTQSPNIERTRSAALCHRARAAGADFPAEYCRHSCPGRMRKKMRQLQLKNLHARNCPAQIERRRLRRQAAEPGRPHHRGRDAFAFLRPQPGA